MDPSEKQLAFLSKFNVWPGKTSLLCSRMIGYVIEGNGVGPAHNKFDRAKLLREVQDKYLGMTVRDPDGKRTGTVQYVIPKSRYEISHEQHTESGLGMERDPLPFLLCITWREKSVDKSVLVNVNVWQLVPTP